MSIVHEPLETAAEHYARAYAIHYTSRDLLRALQEYVDVIELHPGEIQAGYARSQIANIVNLVVPAGELLTSQTALALGHIRRNDDMAVTAVQP